jgi:type III restriction enzyme
MPTLNWIGKEAVVEHHTQVPFHLLRCDPDLSVGEAGSGNLLVSPDCCFTYDPHRYPIHRPYRGAYGFKKHYYPQVGAFDSGEEFEYAQFLDTLPEVRFWVRNPARGSKAFWLQTCTDKFYPDFVCLLHDGRYFVIEYKSERDWSNDDSKEKRKLGALWEKRSHGTCLFVMPKGKDFAATRAKSGGQ